MIAIYSLHHLLHNPPKEFISNQVTAYGESPERAELVFEALMDTPGITLMPAQLFDSVHFHKVHAPDYLAYLENAYSEWIAAGLWAEGILPEFFAVGALRGQPPASSPLGLAGYYMTDSCTMIVQGTWEAVRHSACTALTGAQALLNGEPVVFSLCRPPGHHAGHDFAGGYCFLNNAAIAAAFLRDGGAAEEKKAVRAAILDLDFHHGNGTQDIVQRTENILLVSIHGDPAFAYPYIMGYAHENSRCNYNFPLREGISDAEYWMTFCEAAARIRDFGASYLIISLGVDTFEKDTLGTFQLSSNIYGRMSRYLLEELGLPMLVVMEGGYNTEYLAQNVLSFLAPLISEGGVAPI